MTNEAISDHGEPQYVCFVEAFPNEADVWHVLCDTLQDALGQEPFGLVWREFFEEVFALPLLVVSRKDYNLGEFSGEQVENFTRLAELLRDGHTFKVSKAGKRITIKRIAAYHHGLASEFFPGVNRPENRCLIMEGYVEIGDEKKPFGVAFWFQGVGPALPRNSNPLLES